MTDAPEALPPEVNSALVHGGAGPEPLLQAATAFATAAMQDEVSAQTLMSILAGVQAEWSGQTAEQAAGQLQPLIAWFHALAANGTASSEQIAAAASSVAQAIAVTPHPVVVDQNRVTWGVLNGTNFMGINTPAINEKDAEYLTFWLQAAFGRGTSDIETEVATDSLMPWQPPPMTVNAAAMGMPISFATGVASAAASQLPMSVMERSMDEVALDGLLTRGATGDVAGSAMQRPSTSLMASAAQQSDPSQAAQHQQQGANPLDQLSSGGSQGVMQMASSLPSMLSSVGQLPTQGISTLTQPLSQVGQLPTQFSSMLQPLLSSAAMGNKGLTEAAALPGRFAAGTGELSAAITRPASGGGAGLRLPGSSIMGGALEAAEPPSAAAARAASALRAGTSGATAAPAMMGAPVHPQSRRDQGQQGNKYDLGYTLNADTKRAV